jgi:hypothetical protein
MLNKVGNFRGDKAGLTYERRVGPSSFDFFFYLIKHLDKTARRQGDVVIDIVSIVRITISDDGPRLRVSIRVLRHFEYFRS